MNLRTKLLASFAVFILALLVLGGWSIWNLRQLGRVSQRILSENSASVTAAEEMKHSAERIDSALALSLLGRDDRARSEIDHNRLNLDQSFDRAAANITEIGESALIEDIRRERDDYYRQVNDYLAAIDAGRDQRSVYLEKLQPAFHDLLRSSQQLLQLNREAMARKSDLAASVARRGQFLTLSFAGILVLSGIGLAYFISGLIVQPILDLKESAAQIAGGNLSARARIRARDEMGILAAEFNRMAERVEQVRRSDLGQMLLARQTTEVALKSIYDPLIILDPGALVTKLNPAAERIFGAESHALGRSLADLCSDQRLAFAVNEALRSQQAITTETVASAVTLPVDGTERAFRIETTPMLNDDGRILGAIMLLDDVTHLREIDRLKSEFIDTAAARLQQPLRDAELAIHALLSEVAGELNDNQRDLLENCRSDIERLEKVIQDLLTLSRLESGEWAPHMVPTDTAAFLNKAADQLRPRIEGADLTFDVSIDPRLPVLEIDPDQIRRVIDELADNAIRCTPRGGEIRMQASIQEDAAVIRLSDSGCGIPKQELPRIFHRFTHIPDTPAGGTGLGLAITKRLIEAHGGQISVSSTVDKGTTFTIKLVSKE